MKSALECNPHSNVIRNFWEKKKRNPRIVFELIRYAFLNTFEHNPCLKIRLFFVNIVKLFFKQWPIQNTVQSSFLWRYQWRRQLALPILKALVVAEYIVCIAIGDGTKREMQQVLNFKVVRSQGSLLLNNRRGA